MKNKIKNAEITTQQIILFFVLAGSFIVILFFIFRLDLGGTSESEVCHASVVTRSSGFLLQQTVPLNCKTSYVCLSKDGSCEKMTSSEIVKVKTKEEVYKALAEEGANCWWMFGEGKADYIGVAQASGTIGDFTSDLYCSICSQVAFDDSLYSLFVTNLGIADLPVSDYPSLISKEDFYGYLAETSMSGKDITYLDYFLGLENSELISEALRLNKSNFGYIDVKKQHLIMMGEFSKVELWQDILTGIKKGVLLFLVLPVPLVGGPAGIALVVSTVYNPFGQKGYMIGTVMQGESGHAYLSPAIVEANSEDYNQFKCADIKTLA